MVLRHRRSPTVSHMSCCRRPCQACASCMPELVCVDTFDERLFEMLLCSLLELPFTLVISKAFERVRAPFDIRFTQVWPGRI